MSEVTVPLIRSIKTGVDIFKEGIEGRQLNFGVYRATEIKKEIPDIAGYIQNSKELTRSNIIKILKNSGRLNDVLKNPQFFLDLAIKQINDVLSELMVDGIKYEKIGKSEFYSMERFAKDEIESNKENLYNLINQDKTLHNNNVYDSKIEEQFAKDRKSNE